MLMQRENTFRRQHGMNHLQPFAGLGIRPVVQRHASDLRLEAHERLEPVVFLESSRRRLKHRIRFEKFFHHKIFDVPIVSLSSFSFAHVVPAANRPIFRDFCRLNFLKRAKCFWRYAICHVRRKKCSFRRGNLCKIDRR